MKRFNMYLAVCFLLSAFCSLTGCIRSSVYYVDRVDQELKGNRGYIYGTSPQKEEVRPTKKAITKIEIEIPLLPWEKAREK